MSSKRRCAVEGWPIERSRGDGVLAGVGKAVRLFPLAILFAAVPLVARGVLLVGAANGEAVQQYDSATGAALGSFTSGGLGTGGYSAMAFGPNGNLFVKYWSFGGRVDEFDGSTGAFLGTFVPTNGGSGFTGIVFSPDGLYFYHGDSAGNIDRHDAATGALLVDNFIPVGSGGLAGPGGMRFGPGGDLYVRNTNFPVGTFNVLRFDGTTGAFEGEFVPNGSGGLGGNGDLLFGPDGHLYVADNQNGVVRRYDGTTGASLGVFASGGGLRAPYGLAFGPGGDLFVADMGFDAPDGSDAVLRFDGTTGAFVGVFAIGTNPNPSYVLFTEMFPTNRCEPLGAQASALELTRAAIRCNLLAIDQLAAGDAMGAEASIRTALANIAQARANLFANAGPCEYDGAILSRAKVALANAEGFDRTALDLLAKKPRGALLAKRHALEELARAEDALAFCENDG